MERPNPSGGAAALWVETRDLAPGDHFVTQDADRPTLRAATLRADLAQTTNLEVADLHTFLVGEDGLVVHNCPTSEKFARSIARRLERALGKDARKEFHDMKDAVIGDRTRQQLIEDARSLFLGREIEPPGWLK